MICPPCREAGVLNRQNNEADSLGYLTGMQFAIMKLHEQCEAPSTCPCQHRLGRTTP